MKRGTESLLKFKKLQRALDLTEWQAEGLLSAVWRFTAKNCPHGDIGRFTDEDIAMGIDWRGEPRQLIVALVAERWIDASDKHRLVIHDWPEHCEDAVHVSLAKNLDVFADGSRPKLTRIPKKDRRQIEAEYKKRAETLPSVLQTRESVFKTQENTQPSQGQGLNQAKPSQVQGQENSLDQISVSDAEPIAAGYFAGLQYRGDAGGNLWGIAALSVKGRIPEHWTADAIAGTNAKHPKPKDAVAYFYRIVDEHAVKSGTSLKDMLRSVRLVPNWPTGPPKARAANGVIPITTFKEPD